MSIKNGLPEQIKLSATLAAELNPSSPVVMAGNPADKIALASRLGYDAVELHWANPAHTLLAAIAAACRDNQISGLYQCRMFTSSRYRYRFNRLDSRNKESFLNGGRYLWIPYRG
ncbi:MAG TPA: hypothetical protein VN381_14410 [Anaerovoracaceae bacterium]|nr:hypothetical protein [Anaerovoracaceae bacterium]